MENKCTIDGDGGDDRDDVGKLEYTLGSSMLPWREPLHFPFKRMA